MSGSLDRERQRRDVEPTFFSRYECKYTVDPSLLPEIRHFIRPFTEPDRFAAVKPDFRYAVCSLYLDSQDLALYRQTVAGERERFKLRVRTYSDAPFDAAFFEVKSKLNNVVHKRRVGLTRPMAHAVLEGGGGDLTASLSPGRRGDLDYFLHRQNMTGARPVVRVRYLREAYQALGGEPVRITIDTDLSHAVTLDGELGHTSGRWMATPQDGLIVEVKFTERVPWWVQQLVRTFGLHQRAVPKYVMSIDHMLLENRNSAFNLGGELLPPRGA